MHFKTGFLQIHLEKPQSAAALASASDTRPISILWVDRGRADQASVVVVIETGNDWDLVDRQPLFGCCNSYFCTTTRQHLFCRKESEEQQTLHHVMARTSARPQWDPTGVKKSNWPALNVMETMTFLKKKIILSSLFCAFVFNGFRFSNTFALLPGRIVELKPTNVGSAPSGVSGYFLLGCSIM